MTEYHGIGNNIRCYENALKPIEYGVGKATYAWIFPVKFGVIPVSRRGSITLYLTEHANLGLLLRYYSFDNGVTEQLLTSNVNEVNMQTKFRTGASRKEAAPTTKTTRVTKYISASPCPPHYLQRDPPTVS